MISAPRPSPRAGRVRAARLTDLHELGELSRQSHQAPPSHMGVRTLGLPVEANRASVFTLFRLPLAALLPGDLLYVYVDKGHVKGLAHVEHESVRDEWTIVELDALDDGSSGDVRYRLIQRVVRDAAKRDGMRYHVACADQDGNVELFLQAAFMRYAEELLLYRAPERSAVAHIDAGDAATLGIRPAGPLDALALDRLYRASTPGPVALLEGYRQPDWERQGNSWRVPRSALTPILRFADIDAFVQEDMDGGSSADLLAFCQIGTSKTDQPHYQRVLTRPGHDPSDLIAYGLSMIGEQTHSRWTDLTSRWPAAARGLERGVLSSVRTYEQPLDRRFEEQGFDRVAQVSLLVKEVAERVKKQALVPAVMG